MKSLKTLAIAAGIVGATLPVGMSARAAIRTGSAELECLTDQLTRTEYAAIGKAIWTKGKAAEAAQNAADKKIDRLIANCRKTYPWGEEELDIASVYVETFALEVMFHGAIKAKGLNMDTVERLYKAEPLSAKEMTEKFADEQVDKPYRTELAEKLTLTGFSKKQENIDLGVSYIQIRAVHDALLNEFDEAQFKYLEEQATAVDASE